MPFVYYLAIWLADQLVGGWLVGWLVDWLVILNCKLLNKNSVFNGIFNFTLYWGKGFFPGGKAAGA